jgi:hypothetical protein
MGEYTLPKTLWTCWETGTTVALGYLLVSTLRSLLCFLNSLSTCHLPDMPDDFSARAVSALARHDYITDLQRYRYVVDAVAIVTSGDAFTNA